ncbi:MAG: ABC transporter, partial [Pseudomonadota bacterium]|nr:ABC transporter [Pseudomonadota bacterium]
VIQHALERLMKNRTTMILAHRLSSVIHCDRILVLDRGRVAESGNHGALMEQGGIYANLMSEQAQDAGRRTDTATSPENVVDKAARNESAEEGITAPTEGIIKAEGLNWRQVVRILMGHIMPWKGRLILTFLFGVLRVVAFIGVGVLSALIVLALRNQTPYGDYLVGLAVAAPLSGILHWLESWIAHDMAFRLLAEMRVRVFRKLDQLAPAYL